VLAPKAGRLTLVNIHMEHLMASPCSSAFPHITAKFVHLYLIAVLLHDDM
jgi:hypothetical protein